MIVPDYQLSLAIGKEGQNARLAARLTGWRVDIKSESQLAEEEAGYAGEEWAEGEWVTNAAGEMVWQPAEGGEALSAQEYSTPAEPGGEQTPIKPGGSEESKDAEAPSAAGEAATEPAAAVPADTPAEETPA